MPVPQYACGPAVLLASGTKLVRSAFEAGHCQAGRIAEQILLWFLKLPFDAVPHGNPQALLQTQHWSGAGCQRSWEHTTGAGTVGTAATTSVVPCHDMPAGCPSSQQAPLNLCCWRRSHRFTHQPGLSAGCGDAEHLVVSQSTLLQERPTLACRVSKKSGQTQGCEHSNQCQEKRHELPAAKLRMEHH